LTFNHLAGKIGILESKQNYMNKRIQFKILQDVEGSWYITRNGRPVNNDCVGVQGGGMGRTWKSKENAMIFLDKFGWTNEEASILVIE